MDDPRHLSCVCGKMKWHITAKADGTHLICHCKDCAAFSKHLKRSEFLENGGTEAFQCLPRDIHFDAGQDNLRLLRLSDKGLHRYFAGCCNTPIANTPPNALPFVSAILPKGRKDFGRIKCVFKGEQAPKPVKSKGVGPIIFNIFRRMITALITGQRASPFLGDDKKPIVPPYVLNAEELKAARS